MEDIMYLDFDECVDIFIGLEEPGYDDGYDDGYNNGFSIGATLQNNKFWDNIQQYGNRDDYAYAFCNSAYLELTPKYPINTSNAMYMFMGCSVLEDASNVLVNITSDNPNMMYACANCNTMTKAPIFNFKRAAIVKSYMSTYTACYKLKSVSVYWGDGTADAVTQRNACQNMFFKCWDLTNIDFGGEETGSPFKLDLSYAKTLTTESVQSLLTSLKTIPAGSAGVYEITLASETVALLSQNFLDGFTSKGWTIKQETREETESEE